MSSIAELVSAPAIGTAGAGRVLSAPPRRWSRRVAADLVGLFDVLAVTLGVMVPAAIYVYTGGATLKGPGVAQGALVAAIIVYSCLRAWNLYDTAAMHAFPIQPGSLLSALLIAFLAIFGLGSPFAPSELELWLWYATWVSASFTLLLANRIASRWILARLTAAGRFDTRVAVYGAGNIARRVRDHLDNARLGVSFVGMYDDRQEIGRVNTEGLSFAGRLQDLIEAGRDGRIDQIIVALPQAADRRTNDIVRSLERLPVSVHVVTHIASDLVDDRPVHRVSSLGPVGLIDVKLRPLADWGLFVKRLEDNLLGMAALLVALPVMLLIAASIRLESPGPVLFRQRRRGLNGRVFEVLKFRTMCVLEDGEVVNQARRDDDRVTSVGRFLRRTSLDELPQLVNVMRGEMSLVGPRPHAIAHDDQWGAIVEQYANRHQMKPGLTGLAQIEGFRGEVRSPASIEARIACDLDYITRWSLSLDLWILWRTLFAVVIGRNAH